MSAVKKTKPRRRIVYDPDVFIERVHLLRSERGLSRVKMAKLVGTSANLICWWETGRNNPSVFMLFRIARELDVSVDWLIGLIDERKKLYEGEQ